MGIFNLFTQSTENAVVPTVDAASSPYEGNLWTLGGYIGATRQEAMAVPTIARARNIICSTIASLPIEQYNKFTGAHVEPTRVFNQPDSRVPGSYIYSYIAEDLLFRGVAYGVVMAQYGDGRVSEWTRVAPDRVAPQLNSLGTEVIGYTVDGKAVPNMGIGSLIVFYGLDEGLLSRAGKTIRAAAALEAAAELYAKEPVPQMALESNGTNLTAERIKSLLSAWPNARRTRSTAFLNADVSLEVLGIDPAKLQLNEARQYVALELCRAIGLPAYFASAETTSMTYSNAISERRALIDFSLRNILVAIEQRLSMPDFCVSSVETRFSLDDFLRGDPLQRAQVYQILNSIGAMSIEQIQEEEDLIK